MLFTEYVSGFRYQKVVIRMCFFYLFVCMQLLQVEKKATKFNNGIQKTKQQQLSMTREFKFQLQNEKKSLKWFTRPGFKSMSLGGNTTRKGSNITGILQK